MSSFRISLAIRIGVHVSSDDALSMPMVVCVVLVVGRRNGLNAIDMNPQSIARIAGGCLGTAHDNLRRILLAHDVELPTGAKRSYVRAFDDLVSGNRGGILRAHAEKRRPGPVKTQGIAPAERDNHLTAAFLGAEWFYLAPGFDVRILTGHEIRQIIEKHGLDRDRRVWKKAELVTLFERSVVAIRHTEVRKQVQTAGSFQRNHDINDIVNWEDSDEGDRSELADTPPSSMSWDQHDLRSDAAAVDDAKADDDGDEGGKAEPVLGMLSVHPWTSRLTR